MKKILILGIFFFTILFSSCNCQDGTNINNTSCTSSNNNSSYSSTDKENSTSQDEEINAQSITFTKGKRYLKDENDENDENEDDDDKEEIGHIRINGKFYMDQVVTVVKQKDYWIVKVKDEMPIKETISHSQQFKNWIKTQKLSENLIASTYDLKITDGKDVSIHSFSFDPETIVEIIDKNKT